MKIAVLAAHCGALATPAYGQGQDDPNPPAGYPSARPYFNVDGRDAFETAREDPNVAKLTAERGQLDTRMEVDDEKFQVGFFDGEEEVVQVLVDGITGEVTESWTGDQVAWQMARGYPEQFGHALNAPYVWIPLALIFFFGLFDFRRPFRLAHLDLLVLLSFGISHAAFNNGDIGLSVPLAYPPLLYLLARMLWVGFRAPPPVSGTTNNSRGLRPSATRTFLVIACLFLVAFRLTLNLTDSGVIDVGYAGVVGADKVTEGKPIYGENAFPENNRFGDTYGPANYYSYVPFELALPWSGEWDGLPSAHAAAIFFDLAAALGLFVLGWRTGRRGNRGNLDLGLLLSFAWLAYPYTAFALQSNSNDSLVAAFLVWGLVALGSPAGRGALVALASMVKFAPLALVPLYLVGRTGLASRMPALKPALVGAAAALFTTVLLLANPAIDPGLATFYERTIESQLDRESPFSIWGQVGGLETAQKLVLAGAAVLGVLVALWPARRTTGQVAALGAAVLIASQLAVDHWFYLYIPWFCGLVFVALLCRSQTDAETGIA